MSTRRLQGFALIASAIFTLIGAFGPESSFFGTMSIIAAVLFILGISAVYTAQPIGVAGLVGVVLMIASAVIFLGFRLLDIELDPAIVNILFWTSAIAGLAGRVIVGWLTIQHDVFPAWVGWALIAEGVINFAGGLFGDGSLFNVIAIAAPVVGALALFGYGYYLATMRPTQAIA